SAGFWRLGGDRRCNRRGTRTRRRAGEGVERVLRETAKRLEWGDDWQIIQRRWFEDMLSDKTVKRLGRVEEVADLVTFVASPLADYINGANLRIDGGKSPSVN